MKMQYIYIITFSLAFIACGKPSTQPETTNTVIDNTITVTKAQFDSEKMELGTLSEQEFHQTVKTNGFIDVPPQNKASVSTFMGGYIKRTPLLIGDKIRKGQLLVTLENTEFVEIQQQYLEVSEQLGYLKSEYERQETLYKEKITSQKNFLKAKSTYKSTLAHYNGLRKKLTMMHMSPTAVEKGNISSSINIYAPIAGYITKVNVSTGTYISPADEILEIINTDHIHLELSVFEKDILKIKKDQQINFKIPEASDSIFIAEVHLVGTSVNNADRTIKVHGHIEEDGHTNFVMGMFVDAEIQTASSKAIALPETAISEDGEHKMVLKLEKQENGTYYFKPIEIKVGKKSKGFVEIISNNIKTTDKILSKGAYALIGTGGGGHSH